jgi:hypothetical protein
MNHLSRLALIGPGVLLLAATAGAQYRNDPYYRNNPYYRGPNGNYYDRGNPNGAPYRGGDIVDRVLGDLDRSQYSVRGGRHEWKELDQARRDLIRFRENWMRGRFDRDRIDGAIHHVQRLVDSAGMSPRDRDMLSRDLFALRDFRAGRGYASRPY